MRRCRFNDLDGDGIFVDNDGTDATISNHWEVEDCEFVECGEDVATGYGFRVADSANKANGGNLPHLRFKNCTFSDNGGGFYGGISYGGFTNCTFAYSTDDAQVNFNQNTGNMVVPEIEGCNFEGGEAGEVIINDCYGARVSHSRLTGTFKAGNIPTTSFGFRFGNTGNAEAFDFRNIVVNYDNATLTTFTAFDVGSNASGCNIQGVFYSLFDAGYTKYANSGNNTTIWERSGWIKPPGHQTTFTSIGSTQSHTPDFAESSRYRYNITDSAAVLTVNNPDNHPLGSSSEAGQPMYFTFFNNSGSAMDFSTAVLFGSEYTLGDVPTGGSSWPNSTYVTLTFLWDVTNTQFLQHGDSGTPV